MEAANGSENKIPKKTRSAGTSRNTAILLLCMGVAAFLWLLIKLSATYTSHVPVTLVYANLPEDKVAVRDLPAKSKVLVNATGFKLLMANFQLVNITLPITYRENNTAFLLARNLQNELAGDMPPGYQLISFSPDTIFLQFDVKATKKVPVRLLGEISYAKQFEGLAVPKLSPDSVTVSGPESVLDTLTHWPTELVKHTELKETKTGSVNLRKPTYSSITLSVDKADYEIGVESYTQITREIDIVLLNVPKNKNVTPYPKKVKVFVHVGLSNLDAARNASITATADFEEVNLKKDRFVGVKLSGYPDYMKISGFEPRNIEFIVYN